MTSRPTMCRVFSDAASVANRTSERRASSTGSATNVQSFSAPAFGAMRAVGDLHAEAGEPPRHLDADAAEAEDAGALAVHAALQGIAALRRPGADPHPGVGADHAARQREHHGDAEIGDIPGQHVGRVGDADAARPRGGEVDRVEADAIDGNDLERGQGVDQRAPGAQLAARGDGADIRCHAVQAARQRRPRSNDAWRSDGSAALRPKRDRRPSARPRSSPSETSSYRSYR